MKERWLFWVLMLLLPSIAYGEMGDHPGEKTKRTGILLVAFGSTAPRAEAAYEALDRKVRASFPDNPVRWAYTSSMVRKRLAERGKNLDSPEAAMARMKGEGFTQISVQPLLVIPGAEFHELCGTVDAFRRSNRAETIRVGAPLLCDQEDMEKAVKAVGSIVPSERKKDEAVVLMGHGSSHPANAFYAALMFQIQRKDPLVFVGCVAGYPDIEEIAAMLGEKRVRRAYLLPFTAVAGDHAVRDMAGDGESSWKSTLTDSGFQCVPILKGIAEYDAFAGIWVDHVKVVMAQLGEGTMSKFPMSKGEAPESEK